VVGDRRGRERAGFLGRGPGRWRAARPGVDRRRPQAGRIGVEAENDLAAALFDERRQPVGKRIPGGEARVGTLVQPLLTALLSAEPALNLGTLLAAISMRSPVCGFTP
jgi:hypothetical protein